MTCVTHPTGFTSPMLTFRLGTFWEQMIRPYFSTMSLMDLDPENAVVLLNALYVYSKKGLSRSSRAIIINSAGFGEGLKVIWCYTLTLALEYRDLR